ncbi:hypothetical protein Hanom_Chr16g01455321 [Helianthus anomalus]
MAVAVLPEGQPLWVDQIRGNFLHPSSESMETYATTIIGDDDEDETDTDINPIREEFILLSSVEYVDASYHLIHRSSRAGPQRGLTEEPIGEAVPTPVVDPQVGVASQAKTRKKKKQERAEGKTSEEPVAETPRKRSSKYSFLDYVVVYDTLSGLDAGVK